MLVVGEALDCPSQFADIESQVGGEASENEKFLTTPRTELLRIKRFPRIFVCLESERPSKLARVVL